MRLIMFGQIGNMRASKLFAADVILIIIAFITVG